VLLFLVVILSGASAPLLSAAFFAAGGRAVEGPAVRPQAITARGQQVPPLGLKPSVGMTLMMGATALVINWQLTTDNRQQEFVIEIEGEDTQWQSRFCMEKIPASRFFAA
jgi:hypothetical protein